MTTAIEGCLRQCTVLLQTHQDRPLGSAFFVAPGVLLTAAHVVSGHETVSVWHQSKNLGIARVKATFPESADQDATYTLPDIAHLVFESRSHAPNHNCVRLGEFRGLSSSLLAEGYTRGTVSGYSPDSARLEFESHRPEGGFQTIKLKDSKIDPGLSGGPLLDLHTGNVIGIIKAQRVGSGPIGGVAVAFDTIVECLPDVLSANIKFHQSDQRWEFSRLLNTKPVTPERAAQETLKAIRGVIETRPSLNPENANSMGIHQIPSVRVEPARNSIADQQEAAGIIGDDTPVVGLMRWDPLSARWPIVLLSGGPGVGKSYLLNTHAAVLVDDGFKKVSAGIDSPFSITVPAIVDCAALGRALPEAVDRDVAIAVLIDVFVSSLSDSVRDDVAPELRAMLRIAYSNGLLRSCLDGLDEAGGRERQRVLQILAYLSERGNQVIITTRPHPRLREDTQKLPGCFRADVIGFTPAQAYAFARGWFDHSPALASAFEAGLRDRRELRELARIPLLAVFLCRLVDEGGDVSALPTSPANLIEQVLLGALRGQWSDRSRNTLSADALPDPEQRLALLSQVIGALSRPWRSNLDRFSVAQFDRQLKLSPLYEDVAEAALARYTLWNSSFPNANPVNARGVVRWEFIFDGVLMYESAAGDNEPYLRFAHPILGEYCVAKYLSFLDHTELADLVDEHRWFDTRWDQVWRLAAELVERPEDLVEAFLHVAADPWSEQLLLAGRCACGAGSRIGLDVTSEVAGRLFAGLSTNQPFERDRILAIIGEAIRIGIPAVWEYAERCLLADDLGAVT